MGRPARVKAGSESSGDGYADNANIRACEVTGGEIRLFAAALSLSLSLSLSLFLSLCRHPRRFGPSQVVRVRERVAVRKHLSACVSKYQQTRRTARTTALLVDSKKRQKKREKKREKRFKKEKKKREKKEKKKIQKREKNKNSAVA